jgi:hypothetical protein
MLRFWRYYCFVIYGITFTTQDVMPEYIDAYGFILLWVQQAMLLFWILVVSCQKKIAIPRIIAAAFFLVAFNMLTFFWSLTSPISASVMVTTPMIVHCLIIMKERMQKRMVTGITRISEPFLFFLR